MTTMLTETKPAESAGTIDAPSADDLDALLAQADILAADAAPLVAEESPPVADESQSGADMPPPVAAISTEAQATPMETAPVSEGPDPADPGVNSSGGIGRTLDDLDNLLEELGEKPQAEGEVNPDAGHPAEATPDSPADAASASESPSALAGPMPRQAPAPAGDDAPDGPAAPRSRLLPVRLLHGLGARLAGLLAIIDIPFARLSPRIKSILGYAAVATLVVAAAVWFAGPSLIHH